MSLSERREQLLTLEDAYRSCVRGHGRVVVVSGPLAGGKTALLHAFGKTAVESGARYIEANASRTERRLPLGTVAQLFRATRQAGVEAAESGRMLDDGVLAAVLHDGEPEALEEALAPVLRGLTQRLLALAEHEPLVIGIDDVQYADVPSLLFLAQLARRAETARVLVVVTEGLLVRPGHPLLAAELSRRPGCVSISVGPLSAEGVAGLLGELLDDERATVLAPASYALTGGNPLLVRALAHDVRFGAPGDPAEPVPGRAFERAVVSCLHRGDTLMRRTAQCLAVLGEPAPAERIGHMLDMPADVARRALAELERAALLDACWFRHPRVAAAVLDDMDPAERADVHEQAAAVLRREGARAGHVARHIAATERIGAPWMAPVLREAAEHILTAGGDTEDAFAYLRLAAGAGDERHRATIASMLLRAAWRIDPNGAIRYLDDALSYAHQGLLDESDTVAVARYLLWYGRLDEALRLMADLDGRHADPTGADPTRQDTRQLPAFAFPGHTDALRGCASGSAMHPAAASMRQVLKSLWTVLEDGPDGSTVQLALQLLQRSHWDGAMIAGSTMTLTSLLLSDRLDMAAVWCDRLLAAATPARAQTWRAILTAIRAEVSLRRGDLRGAESQARAALTLLPPRSWGILVGVPLSTLLRAATEAADFRLAAGQLNIPVPAAMFETPLGPHYLYARGLYQLAGGDPEAALSDIETCGTLLIRWQLDLPALIPWRTAVARAYAAQGRTGQARALVQDQLARLRPGHLRTRGMSLRILASVSDEAMRPALLSEATSLLKAAGDRLELAYAYADLSVALDRTGETRRAELVRQLAQQLGIECGVPMLPQRSPASSRAPEAHPGTMLSRAERRVAALAALGHSNREIAGQLHLTVSTVEQHLTRVYRKLRVSRRTDLPPGLHVHAHPRRVRKEK
ncbi:AAA family ATPase [Micromonospora sp. NPDC049101]|uniref:AAA family ATPase n=1 Tax=Micromonospora sp. NPDC049101 TaxID=3155032 RepID=UPI0033D60A70